jgi:FkbH-like protein
VLRFTESGRGTRALGPCQKEPNSGMIDVLAGPCEKDGAMRSRELIVLGDTTVGAFARELQVQCATAALPWTVRDGGFDSWEREIYELTSPTRRAERAALGFLLSPRMLEAETGETLIARLEGLLHALAEITPERTVLFGNLFPDPHVVLPLTQTRELVRRARQGCDLLEQFSERHPWFYVVDHATLALSAGVAALHDPRYEALGALYFSPAGTRRLSALWCRTLGALTRTAAKVLVVDLDNVLWGGILGEDGAEGLKMARSGIGLFYRRFQESLLTLKKSGVLLAVCSKNNPADAAAVLREHPDCLLRPKDFAAMEISWDSKSDGLLRLGTRLGLGLDSFVFVDDSPFEREEVRMALPEVRILEFPASPEGLVRMIEDCQAFDRLRVTAEDALRAQSYADEAHRQQLRASARTPADFYRSLQLGAKLTRAQPGDFERLHQLIHKTNQFNLTAQRLTAEELRAKLQSSRFDVFTIRVTDRFGDSGLVGVAIVDKTDPMHWVVENFLLSCRVIGRTVEHAFVSWLGEQARKSSAHMLTLLFVASGRNQVAREFLDRSGLKSNADASQWALEVARHDALPPHYVAITVD